MTRAPEILTEGLRRELRECIAAAKTAIENARASDRQSVVRSHGDIILGTIRKHQPKGPVIHIYGPISDYLAALRDQRSGEIAKARAALEEFRLLADEEETREEAPQQSMSMEDTFILTIRDAPLDDGRWLVFADWLEEQGDPRAESMRALVKRSYNRGMRTMDPAEVGHLRLRDGFPSNTAIEQDYAAFLQAHGVPGNPKNGDRAYTRYHGRRYEGVLGELSGKDFDIRGQILPANGEHWGYHSSTPGLFIGYDESIRWDTQAGMWYAPADWD
jgi:uncharacterized protein (TIGR02996 family)